MKRFKEYLKEGKVIDAINSFRQKLGKGVKITKTNNEIKVRVHARLVDEYQKLHDAEMKKSEDFDLSIEDFEQDKKFTTFVYRG